MSLDETLLADIGLDRREIGTAIHNSCSHGRRLERMLGRLGLAGHGYLNDPSFRRSLQRTCSTCNQARKGERWLDGVATEPGCPSSCANACEFALMTNHPDHHI